MTLKIHSTSNVKNKYLKSQYAYLILFLRIIEAQLEAVSEIDPIQREAPTGTMAPGTNPI